MNNDLKQAAALLGRKGGQVRSEAKTRAVRENGKLGGRPRKVQPEPAAVKPQPQQEKGKE